MKIFNYISLVSIIFSIFLFGGCGGSNKSQTISKSHDKQEDRKDQDANSDKDSPQQERPTHNYNIDTVISFVDKGHGFEPWKIGKDGKYKMIKDLNTVPAGINLSHGKFVTLNKITYFFADDGINGYALYRTDGTESGTWMVKDIFKFDRYLSKASFSKITILNDKLYFIAPDGALWESDGTKEGTKRIFKNLTLALNIVAVGDSIYFEAKDADSKIPHTVDGNYDYQLYRYNDSFIKPKKLTNFRGYGADFLTPMNGKLYFRFYYYDSEQKRHKSLFRYDPISGDMYEYKNTSIHNGERLIVSNNNIFKLSYSILYRLNKESETFKAINLFSNDAYLEYVASDDNYIYLFDREDYKNRPLYRIDTKSTVLDVIHATYNHMAYLNGSIYFIKKRTKFGDKAVLMRWDKESKDAVEVMEYDLGEIDLDFSVTDAKPMLKNIANKLYFVGYKDKQYSLWESDGSTIGTHKIANIGNMMSDIRNCNNRPCFVASTKEYGSELWIYDDEIRIIKDIDKRDQDSMFEVEYDEHTSGYSYKLNSSAKYTPSREYFKVGNLYYFVANVAGNRLHDRVYKIFRSDGTKEGTFPISDKIFKGKKIDYDTLFTKVGNELYFVVKTYENPEKIYLCKSDGSIENTTIIKRLATSRRSYIDDLVTFNGKVYFNAPTDEEMDKMYASQYALYESNGTKEGTRPIKIFSKEEGHASNLQVKENRLFFMTKGKVWESDGSEENTKVLFESDREVLTRRFSTDMLKIKDDWYLINKSSDVNGFWRLSNDDNETKIYTTLQYNKDSRSTTKGSYYIVSNLYEIVDYAYKDDQLYIVRKYFDDDLSRNVAQLVKLNPDTKKLELIKSDFCRYDSIKNLIVVGNRLYFIAKDSRHGREVWVSDGTSDGTHILKDIMPESDSSNPYIYGEVDGKLLFMATDSEGVKLWLSEGSDDTTVEILREK